MDFIRIEGSRPLCGTLTVQGSKNAALPILAASVLIPGRTVLENCPEISDTACMCRILERLGARVERKGKQVTIDASDISGYRLPGELAARMRSSVVLMGALLGRMKRAETCYPGGCVIGDRPIDLHLKAFRELGASVEEREGVLCAKADRLTGARIRLEFPSVGATQNALLAAVLADGATQIEGCAGEPEVTALCAFLNGAGAKISGGGTSCIEVEGVESLRESHFVIPGDRIVAGTYLIGAMAAGGCICLKNVQTDQLESLIGIASRMNTAVEHGSDWIRIRSDGHLLSPGEVRTESYPGFPTDLQPQLMAALCRAEGESVLQENIFNGRFGVAGELERMGAKITVEGNRAMIRGGSRLRGCRVSARDLRGGAALVLAGLWAEGITQICGRAYIDRGYEDICRDLRKLGARIGKETEIQTDRWR